MDSVFLLLSNGSANTENTSRLVCVNASLNNCTFNLTGVILCGQCVFLLYNGSANTENTSRRLCVLTHV